MKIAFHGLVRALFLIITVGIIMPLLALLATIQVENNTTIEEKGAISIFTNTAGDSARSLLEGNKAAANGLVSWVRQRLGTSGVTTLADANATGTVLESTFIDKSLSELRSTACNLDAEDSGDSFAPTSGMTLLFPTGGTSYSEAWHHVMVSSPMTSAGDCTTSKWEQEKTSIALGTGNFRRTVLSSSDDGISFTEADSSISSTDSISSLDSVATTAVSGQTYGTLSVLARANADNDQVWRSVRLTYGATVGGVLGAFFTETTLQPVVNSLYESAVTLIGGSSSSSSLVSKIAAFVLDPVSGDLYAVRESSSSTVDNCVAGIATGTSASTCLQISRLSHSNEIIRGAAVDAVINHFNTAGSSDLYEGQDEGAGLFLSGRRIYGSSYTSSIGLGLDAVESRLVVVLALPHRPASVTLAVTLPIVIISLVCLIGFFIFWAIVGSKFILKDLHSLEDEMEEVMTLEFGNLEKGEDVLAKQIFTELFEVRDAFLAMADTMYTMTKYIPIEVVRDMMAAGHLNSRIMVSRTVTIIFADIAGFNGFVENINSEDLVEITERYFAVATRNLVSHGCTIDKYMGDCVMGMWGAPLDYARQGFSALCAAIHLIASCRRLKSLFQNHNADISLRIGINKGNAALGNIGSEERIAYTALGDTVNLAARLKGLNKYYSTNIIVSNSVIEDINPTHRPLFGYRRLGLVRVKGKTEPTIIWNPLGIRNEVLARLKQKLAREAKAKKKKEKDKAARKNKAVIHSSSAKRSKSNAGDASTAASSAATTASSEKQADLSEEEEVMMLQRSHGMSEDAYAVLGQLSKSIELFEDMRFEEAVELLDEVLSKRLESLLSLDLDVQALQRQKNFWKLLVQHTPPRDAFDPCDNMTQK